MSRLDWEAAAKRDYIAKNGSVPFWAGLGADENRLEEREVALRARLQAHLSIVEEYAQLSAFERQRLHTIFQRRLCGRLDEERRKTDASAERLLRAIDEYESGLLSLLNGLRPRLQGRNSDEPK